MLVHPCIILVVLLIEWNPSIPTEMRTSILMNSCLFLKWGHPFIPRLLFLLNDIGFISEPHKAEIDAIASIFLYKKYKDNPHLLEQAKSKLQSVRPPPSFAKRCDYRYEGVCMAAFYPAKCFCGAPTKS